jgi:hypothetical protein
MAKVAAPVDTTNALEKLALAKVIGEKVEKAVRLEVKAGAHEFDFTARIKGAMKVGEDFEAESANRARPMLLARVLASALNPAILDAKIKLYCRIIKAVAKIEDEERIEVFWKRIESPVKESADGALAKVMAATKKPAKGRVTMTVTSLEIKK